MNTAVQLRLFGDGDHPRCDLLHSAPSATVAGELGPVALFAAGQVVAYRISSLRRPRLFVFRTLDTVDLRATLVPGVRPRVQLLFALRSAERVRLARDLFACLSATGREPSQLSDAFYLRVGVVLASRLVPRGLVPWLLRRADSEGPQPRSNYPREASRPRSTAGPPS